MDKGSPSMLKATAIGGSVAGVVASVPLVGILNACCCLLVIAGGFLAAFLYSRDCQAVGAEFRPGNGAVVGLVAALFYAVAATVVGTLVQMAMPVDLDQINDAFEQFDLPPETRDTIMRFVESSGTLIGAIFGFFFWLVVAAIFSTIGGLIGGAVFKVERPAPPAPSSGVPPTAPPAPPAAPGS